MKTQELFNYIDELYPRYVEFWKSICTIETPTSDKARVDELGSFLKRSAEELDFKICEHVEIQSGNALCFTMNPDAQGTPVCFSAHMDTVHPVGSFGKIPVHTDDTYIYGPGVADCKGGIAAGFLAMHALKACGFTQRPIKLILQSDEEVGSAQSERRTIAFMQEMARSSAAFLNLETHAVIKTNCADDASSAEPAVIVRKGIIRYRFHVYGISVHSARCQDGANAVAAAAYKILELEKMKSGQALTCCCSMVEGGSAANVVPDHCTFTADIRFADAAQMREAKLRVAQIAAENHIPGSSCKTELLSYRCAMEYEKRNEKLLEKMNAIYRSNGMPILEAAQSCGGSDGSDISAAGIATIDSIGVSGDMIHSLGERAELHSLAACAKRIAVVAMELPLS